MIRWFSIIFFKFQLEFSVTGAQHIPAKGHFILAANHSSYLDPLLLAAATHRGIHFIARDKLLEFPVIGWFLKHANTIPVKRHGSDMTAIKEALRVLKGDKVLGIFPEGTRTKDGNMKKAKSGVGMIVYKAKVQVVPAYISGSFDAMPRRIRTFRRYPVHVYIGEPIDFTKECGLEHSREVYQGISDKIMGQIAELKSRYGKATSKITETFNSKRLS